jgi:hypothetical protein
MTIKGTLTKFETNNYGYTVIWVQGTRYGSDKKGTIQAQVGDTVEFEAFNKPDKSDPNKSWPTFQYQTFRKSQNNDGLVSVPVSAAVAAVAASSPAKMVHGASANNRDSYWSDKEARDIKKDERYQAEIEPRIVFQSSYKLAVDFVDLALRNGAFAALEKAKPTAKLEILQAFVSEQALRIMGDAYAASVPSTTLKAVLAEALELDSDLPASEADDSQWS